MSNESPERRETEVEASTFEGWVTQKASERETSRERVLEQLLDSYWTLEQITQVLSGHGDPPPTAERPNTARDGGGETTGPVTDHTDLLDTVETLQTELEATSRRHEELVDEVRSLSDRLDDAEATQTTVGELAASVDAVATSLETERDRLHARMDDELDNLQTILEYLVESGDELDVRIDEMQREYRAEIRELRAERERLRRLREDARKLGTHHGDCEHCGETVDFALLTAPECPNCARQLVGVTAERDWLVRTSYTATTERRATESVSSDTEPDTPHPTDETPSDDTPHPTDETPSDDTPHPTDETPSDDTPHPTDETPSDDVATETARNASEQSHSASETSGTSPDETEFDWLT